MQRIEPYLDDIKSFFGKIMGDEKDDEESNSITEPFLNQFNFNETCLLLTLIFVVVFMYKKEIMNMLNLK